jgi:hypothetical protein
VRSPPWLSALVREDAVDIQHHFAIRIAREADHLDLPVVGPSPLADVVDGEYGGDRGGTVRRKESGSVLRPTREDVALTGGEADASGAQFAGVTDAMVPPCRIHRRMLYPGNGSLERNVLAKAGQRNDAADRRLLVDRIHVRLGAGRHGAETGKDSDRRQNSENTPEVMHDARILSGMDGCRRALMRRREELQFNDSATPRHPTNQGIFFDARTALPDPASQA